jgi:hypothetical protein
LPACQEGSEHGKKRILAGLGLVFLAQCGLRLAKEIRDLMPYKVFLIDAGEYPRKSANPD